MIWYDEIVDWVHVGNSISKFPLKVLISFNVMKMISILTLLFHKMTLPRIIMSELKWIDNFEKPRTKFTWKCAATTHSHWRVKYLSPSLISVMDILIDRFSSKLIASYGGLGNSTSATWLPVLLLLIWYLSVEVTIVLFSWNCFYVKRVSIK